VSGRRAYSPCTSECIVPVPPRRTPASVRNTQTERRRMSPPVQPRRRASRSVNRFRRRMFASSRGAPCVWSSDRTPAIRSGLPLIIVGLLGAASLPCRGRAPERFDDELQTALHCPSAEPNSGLQGFLDAPAVGDDFLTDPVALQTPATQLSIPIEAPPNARDFATGLPQPTNQSGLAVLTDLILRTHDLRVRTGHVDLKRTPGHPRSDQVPDHDRLHRSAGAGPVFRTELATTAIG